MEGSLDGITKERTMRKTIFITFILGVVALTVALLAQAGSDRKVQPINSQLKTQTVASAAKGSGPQKAPLGDSRQGYRLVTDVIDGFGGKSASDNYGIPVNSGGQPLAIGVSSSSNYWVEGGFVHASFVIRGDANGDGAVGAGDIVYLLNYLFRGDDPPCPMESGDANCSGAVDAGDVVFLISYLYRGGPPPGC
jgi:hypothetical protein